MLLSDYMYDYYAESAQTMTIVMLVVILAISFLLSYVVKRRNGLDDQAKPPEEPSE
jgi:preprotein translocase subunit SecG